MCIVSAVYASVYFAYVGVSSGGEFLADNETCIHVYGANNPFLVLTLHQQRMNTASQSLTLANPNLLNNCRKLMELARIKVNEDGYAHKHGKSRSKQIHSESDTSICSGPRVKQTQTGQNDYKGL